MATYDDYANKSDTEKNGLAIVEASRRLSAWTLDSGSIYTIPFTDSPVITEMADQGVALTEVFSSGAVTAGTYYFDRANDEIFLQTTGSTDPGLSFISIEFRLFFAEVPTIAPHDLATGFNVEWVAVLRPLSEYGVKLDNKDQIGLALEGSGSVGFFNDLDYWRVRYDQYYFENKRCFIYSWSHGLDISEAKLLYRGRIQGKSYSLSGITFKLKDFINELRAPPPLSNIEQVAGALVPDSLLDAKQRRIYGYVFGYRPTNIDQVLAGYSLVGTVSLTNGSATVTGVGTSFLNDLSPDDELVIDGVEDKLTIETIASDTSLTLTEDYDQSAISTATFKVEPDLPKRYTNRTHFVSGDTLSEPSTTIVSVLNGLVFTVADASNFRDGDPIIVNGIERTILRVSGNVIRVTVFFNPPPAASDVVTRPSFAVVKIDNDTLLRTRDFTVPASNDRIVLTDTAEFNVAKTLTLSPGTVSFTTSSRTVTGTSTKFTSTVKPGDWLRVKGQSVWYEILQIASDTSLTIRVVSAYTDSGATDLRQPNTYEEGVTVVTCDAIGITADGTKTGSLLSKGPEIVEDVLKQIGIDASDINSSTFTTANDLAEGRIGLVIPDKYTDTKVPKGRDTIDRINRTIIGALVQNEDFQLEYAVLDPSRGETDATIDETDVLTFSITSDSNNIVKTVIVDYAPREYDPLSKGPALICTQFVSDNAQYLAKTEKSLTIKSLFVDLVDSQRIAQRMSAIRDTSSAIVRIKTKLQTSRLQVTNAVKLDHPKLYNRYGSADPQKMAFISSLKKSSSGVSLELDDLGNSFTTTATVTDNTANDYDSATNDEKVANGYITDNDGTLESDPDTVGLNLIY